MALASLDLCGAQVKTIIPGHYLEWNLLEIGSSNISHYVVDHCLCLSAGHSAGATDSSNGTWALLVTWASHSMVVGSKQQCSKSEYFTREETGDGCPLKVSPGIDTASPLPCSCCSPASGTEQRK